MNNTIQISNTNHLSPQNRPHTNYSRQRSIAIKPRFKSSVKFKKIYCRFSEKKQLVDFAVVKELDEETNLYYYGARYLDPRTSRWLTGDPAIYQGDYIPAPGQSPDKLGGMGGLYNTLNFHAYGYAFNNPIRYVDPNGRQSEENTRPRIDTLNQREWEFVRTALDQTVGYLDTMINDLNSYANGSTSSVSPEMRQYTREWLGIELDSTVKATNLAGDLTRIRNHLASRTIDDFRKDNANYSDFAYKELLEPYIYLTNNFFSTRDIARPTTRQQIINGSDIDTRQGILVHESTHFIYVLNTDDIRRRHSGAQQLARDFPNIARRNALNWEMFFYYYNRVR